jgi:hypothetical protein
MAAHFQGQHGNTADICPAQYPWADFHHRQRADGLGSSLDLNQLALHAANIGLQLKNRKRVGTESQFGRSPGS